MILKMLNLKEELTENLLKKPEKEEKQKRTKRKTFNLGKRSKVEQQIMFKKKIQEETANKLERQKKDEERAVKKI